MTKAPEFWWSDKKTLLAHILAPAGWVYGRIAGRRMLQKPEYRSKLPVICIGNFVAGGTGKTPFALNLADLLTENGHKPGVLLRGYGGKEAGPLLVQPEVHTSEDVGDEALLLAQAGPTVVSGNRPLGAALLEQQNVDLIIMDDGFQNPSLHKDMSIALTDCAVGSGNGYCIPAGPLRAPAQTQIVKTDCLVLVGEGEAAEPLVHLAGRKGLPILHAEIRPEPNEDLQDRPLFAFAGIGRPEKFFQTLKNLGYAVKKTRAFADHHRFTETEAQDLLTQAEAEGLQLVTTAKDMVRLQSGEAELFRWLESRAEVLDVSMEVADESRLIALIKEMLSRRNFHTSP